MGNIHQIEIKNFKSIHHQTIDDCKRINVFIGYPNVGKSNIIEALSLFSIGENNLNVSANIRFEKLTTLFFNGNISENIEVKVNDNRRWVGKVSQNVVQFEEQFESKDKVFKNKKPLLYTDFHGQADFTLGRSFQVSDDSRSAGSFRNPITEMRLSQRLGGVKKYVFKREIQYADSRYDALSYPNGNNLFSILSTHIEIKKQVDDLFKQYNLEMLWDSRQQKFTILKRTEGGVFSIPYDLVADTLQRLIFYSTAILSSKESILLFEEPEAHMFPPYISKLTADIIYDKNQNQYFITTHSPFVLNDFMEDVDKDELSVYAVGYKKSTGETAVHKLSNEEIGQAYQYGIDLFFNLESYLKDAV